MLTWFVDHSQEDNNTSEHPGAGLAMVVDARPAKFAYPDGSAPSNRRQPFDATFGLESVDPVCLTKEVLVKKTVDTVSACATQLAPIATFDDTNPLAYYDAANPQNSVKVAGHGVKATVTAGTTGDLTVAVTNPPAQQ
jgi:immune inhibitor A